MWRVEEHAKRQKAESGGMKTIREVQRFPLFAGLSKNTINGRDAGENSARRL